MRSLKVLFFVLFVTFSFQLAYSVQQAATPQPATEAPTGFDNQSNGLVDQATFDADRDTFNEQEEISNGLGPLYNARSCGDCHANPVTGGSSQVTRTSSWTL